MEHGNAEHHVNTLGRKRKIVSRTDDKINRSGQLVHFKSLGRQLDQGR